MLNRFQIQDFRAPGSIQENEAQMWIVIFMEPESPESLNRKCVFDSNYSTQSYELNANFEGFIFRQKKEQRLIFLA